MNGFGGREADASSAWGNMAGEGEVGTETTLGARESCGCPGGDPLSSADFQCTKPCGAGTRTRLVVCQRPNGERFTDLSCEILDKPPDREQCNVHDCPRDAAWSAGPWSSVRP